MNEVLLKASGIVKTFGDPRRPTQLFWQRVLGRQSPPPWHRVLSGVDLEIRRGETVGLLGHNGAGKSTLLAILAGARNATSGTVERHGRIVPILELGGSFDTNRSGRVNVVEMARSYGIAGRAVDRVVAEAEEFADIGEAFERPLRTLSSGMRARVAFGTAMAIDADLVMLDETLAVGDLSFRLRCYDLIRRRQSEGTSFLLVGHNPNTLANLCSRMIVLNDRNIAFDGDPATAILVYKAIRIGRWATGDQDEPVTIAADGATRIECEFGERIEIVVAVRTTIPLRNVFLNLGFINASGITLSATSTVDRKLDTLAANSSASFRLSFDVLLEPGSYRLVGSLNIDDGEEVESVGYNAGLVDLSVRGDVSHKGIAALRFAIRTGEVSSASTA